MSSYRLHSARRPFQKVAGAKFERQDGKNGCLKTNTWQLTHSGSTYVPFHSCSKKYETGICTINSKKRVASKHSKIWQISYVKIHRGIPCDQLMTILQQDWIIRWDPILTSPWHRTERRIANFDLNVETVVLDRNVDKIYVRFFFYVPVKSPRTPTRLDHSMGPYSDVTVASNWT